MGHPSEREKLVEELVSKTLPQEVREFELYNLTLKTFEELQLYIKSSFEKAQEENQPKWATYCLKGLSNISRTVSGFKCDYHPVSGMHLTSRFLMDMVQQCGTYQHAKFSDATYLSWHEEETSFIEILNKFKYSTLLRDIIRFQFFQNSRETLREKCKERSGIDEAFSEMQYITESADSRPKIEDIENWFANGYIATPEEYIARCKLHAYEPRLTIEDCKEIRAKIDNAPLPEKIQEVLLKRAHWYQSLAEAQKAKTSKRPSDEGLDTSISSTGSNTSIAASASRKDSGLGTPSESPIQKVVSVSQNSGVRKNTWVGEKQIISAEIVAKPQKTTPDKAHNSNHPNKQLTTVSGEKIKYNKVAALVS